jgi:glycerophosphoryl diester phosphodiesterase
MITKCKLEIANWGVLFAKVAILQIAIGSSQFASAADMSPTPATRLIAEKKVLVIAHRGNSSEFPENTLPAFESGVKVGSDLVELDYHHSADGVPVVLHDEILSRTTDADDLFGVQEPLVGSFKQSELARLDAGAWFDLKFVGTRLPTLEQSLDAIQKGSVTLVERKGGDAATCVKLLEKKKLLDQLVVQSFDWEYVTQCRQLAPHLVLAALGSKPLNEKRLEMAAATGAQVIAWDHKEIRRAEIEAIHAKGLKAWVYTVDDPARARQLMAAGIDGIITNVPGEMIKVRNAEFGMRKGGQHAGQ